MPNVDVSLKWDKNSHTPGRVKPEEQVTVCNPFFYDLLETPIDFNPEWSMANGIVLNWLYAKNGQDSRLLFGVEADTGANLLDFMDKFSKGHPFSLEDANKMTFLGHPTLAYRSKTSPPSSSAGETDKRRFIRDFNNYLGNIGGELYYKHDSWWINNKSGRYGFTRSGDETETLHYMQRVQSIFLERAKLNVGIGHVY